MLEGAQLEAATPARAPHASAREGARIVTVGMSVQANCGTRDHATLLARLLEREGMSSSLHWLAREQHALRPSWAEVSAWSSRLEAALEQPRADAVPLHHSP